jgi:hypothetical protein
MNWYRLASINPWSFITKIERGPNKEITLVGVDGIRFNEYVKDVTEDVFACSKFFEPSDFDNCVSVNIGMPHGKTDEYLENGNMDKERYATDNARAINDIILSLDTITSAENGPVINVYISSSNLLDIIIYQMRICFKKNCEVSNELV